MKPDWHAAWNNRDGVLKKFGCYKETDRVLCDGCGKDGARIRRVTRTYGKGQDLLVIENIPVISCSHCGESYLTAETLHQIEQIKQNRKQLATPRPVAVAHYS